MPSIKPVDDILHSRSSAGLTSGAISRCMSTPFLCQVFLLYQTPLLAVDLGCSVYFRDGFHKRDGPIMSWCTTAIIEHAYIKQSQAVCVNRTTGSLIQPLSLTIHTHTCLPTNSAAPPCFHTLALCPLTFLSQHVCHSCGHTRIRAIL